ncbi:MAG: hypothetical protein WC087_00165 [Candidatus Paceibacterota bacterium]
MHEILILVGCVGCGKDALTSLLMMAYSGIIPVSTSDILGGGRGDGLMIKDDKMVHEKLLNHLVQQGFLNYEKSQKFVFNGPGRTPEQMELLIDFLCEYGMLTKRTRFIKLNINSKLAILRMQKRWLENQGMGTLRKDEKGSADVVQNRFYKRVAEWIRARNGENGKEGLLAIMQRKLFGHKSRVIEIDASQSIAMVALNVVDALGWDRAPLIDVLVREGYDMEGVPGHFSGVLPDREKDHERYETVTVQVQ